MILEVAEFRIKPGTQAEFDAAIKRGVETVIAKAKGYRDYKVQKGIESPRLEAQLLLAHALDCRKTELYTRWDEVIAEDRRSRFRGNSCRAPT